MKYSNREPIIEGGETIGFFWGSELVVRTKQFQGETLWRDETQ